MKNKIVTSVVILLAAVVGLSILSVKWWGSKSETFEPVELRISSVTEPVTNIASLNGIPLKVVLTALQIDSVRATTVSLTDLGFSSEMAVKKIKKSLILYNEHQSKNWLKIFFKFLFWFLLLPIPVILIAKFKMNPVRRRLFYLTSVVIFGIILGADPSPMGTVKDAVFLLTAEQIVFWPRIVALVIFLLTVVLSTKLICSWGCQFGVLQDNLFRFGRNRKDRKGIIKQIKAPFWLSNSVRIGIFVLSVLFALLWSFDIIELIDPFKIYNPLVLTITGIFTIAIILFAALFVYRPWCHFACPFGLVGWFFEKLAIFRIKVDYSICDACQVCNSACPSTVMDAILKQDRTIPDCYGCGVCVESCPTRAISLTASRKYTGNYSDALVNLQTKKNSFRKKLD